MIAINDLRVGNWVIINDKLIDKNTSRAPYQYQIEAFDLYKLDSFELAQENGVDPIHLSPEVLERCGFKHKGGWMGKSFLAEIYDETVEMVFEYMDNNLNVYVDDQRARRLEKPSLHQLQNLYFALTGQELIYKP